MTDERTEQILRRTLAPEIPDENMNQNLKRKMEGKMRELNEKTFRTERGRKRHRTGRTVAMAAALCLVFGTIGVASSGKISSVISKSRPNEFRNFGQLSEAESKAGYEIKAVDSFGNGYSFSGMSIDYAQELDEGGNVLGEYKGIDISYEKEGADGLVLDTMEAVHYHGNEAPAVQTAQIGGIEVSYSISTYKWVPAGYELTPEDRQNLLRSDYNISEGADEISENQVSHASWIENGVYYCITNISGVTPADVMFQMASELIMQ